MKAASWVRSPLLNKNADQFLRFFRYFFLFVSPLFDQDDLETFSMLLAEFAGPCRAAVEQTSRLAREQARELDVLYDAAHTIAGSLNVQQVMDSVLAAICTHLEHHTAILFLLNDERTHLFIAAESGDYPKTSAKFSSALIPGRMVAMS